MFWLIGLDRFVVVRLSFSFFFFPEQNVPQLTASEATATSREKLSSGLRKRKKKERNATSQAA